MKTPITACVALLLLIGASLGACVQTGVMPDGTPLVRDSSLEGWAAMHGGSLDAWEAVDGEIRIVDAGRGGWLRTQRTYRDFELSFDFIIPGGGNSGVGLRCTGAGDPAFTGFEVQIADSFGKGATRESCGAVYNAIPPMVQAVRAPGEWNSYRILLVGDTLNVWLNGVRIHENAPLDDRGIFRNDDQPLPLNERASTGFIAFQDHGEGGLRLRDIEIVDLSVDPDPGDFAFAFDGTTDGWTHRGGGSFTFEDGTLVAADGPGHLFSDRTHEDIEIRALVRVARPGETGASRTGNSGIYFRTVPRPENPDTWPLGYEAQIDNHDPRATAYTGCIYDLAPQGPKGAPVSRDGAWFDYRILAVGDRVRTWVNGVEVVNANLDRFDAGSVAFQTHHPGNRVEFRDVRWRTPSADEAVD
ncbi:MAG: DUF1080 domain-containing protein [Planctomycetota bacterium]